MTTKVVLIGGFLGAGKTTLMLRAAQECVRRGATVGLITNDQGVQLVDTALAVQQDLPVREVTGGCFCCNFPDLMTALTQLEQAVQPDVVFAEPVGSCTDLMATVVRPILHYYPQRYSLAPLSVLFDGARSRGHDTPDVTYLYERQLDEAEYILFNKVDLLTHEAVIDQAAQLQRTHPGARVLPMAACTGQGIGDWLDAVLAEESAAQHVLNIDYARYARAEAELGWLNTQGEVVAAQPFLPRNWMTHFLRTFDAALQAQHASIGHVKLQAGTNSGILKASLTASGAPVSWDLDDEIEPVAQLRFTFNARVNTNPAQLERTLHLTFDQVTPSPAFRVHFNHFECFSPAAPQPTYRMV